MDGLSGAIVTDVRAAGTVALLLLGALVASWTVLGLVIRYLVRERNTLQAKCDQMAEDALVAARANTNVIQSVNSSLQSIDATLKHSKSPTDVMREMFDILDRRDRERTRG